MKLKNKKRAYTLAEIMLVILVLSIIFAAMAPIFTKRKITQFTGKYNVWSYADRVNFNAFYDPGDPSLTGELFFGITPSDGRAVTSEFAPLSKIVIRAGEVTSEKALQRHIQFRYGRTNTDKDGTFAGSWYVNRKNMLLGGSFFNLSPNESIGARDNVSIGYGALDNITTAKNNVAIGYRAIHSVESSENNVGIGHQAGHNNKSDKNVFIGYEAGRLSKASTTVSIGYNAGQGPSSSPQNVFIGALSGGGGLPSSTSPSTSVPGTGNTAIGYNALGQITNGAQNIAIGYNALSNLTTGSNNIAIGYNACSELTTESRKTCIGYNSGPKKRNSSLRPSGGNNASNSGSAFLLWNDNGTGSAKGDSQERVYIGGTPRNYAGDAVLEIHNTNNVNDNLAITNESNSAGSVTTVVNGNLIVRGRPYFTVGTNLIHFHNDLATMKPTANYDPNKPNQEDFLLFFGYRSDNSKCASGDTEFTKYNWNESNPICPDLKIEEEETPVVPPNPPIPDLPQVDPDPILCEDMCRQCKQYVVHTDDNPEHNGPGSNDFLTPQKYICAEFKNQCPGYSCPGIPSDRRLKNVGERFDGGLKQLKKLNVYNFTFKNDEKKHPQVGVIAQELQKVFPNAVFQDENGYLKIRWDDMFYATINAIKELDKKIVALVKRTTKVETQITKLEQENVELKAQVESLRVRVNKLKTQ